MNRLFLTLEGQQCPFRCRYCFVNFSQYSRTISLEMAESCLELVARADIIYPACDVDLFATRQPIGFLWRAAKLGRHISVSSKARIAERFLGDLSQIRAWMSERRSVLKIGISVSTRNAISSIEPGSSSYSDRLRNFEMLARLGIPTAIVLKPLLAEVPSDEYVTILNEVKQYTKNVLIGDEYVDEANVAAIGLAKRVVNWLPHRPAWPTRVAENRENVINAAKLMNYRVFLSDSDLMCSLIEYENGRTDTGLTHVR